MKRNRYERCIELGEYIVQNNATVRATAKPFGVSKSTVHTDITEILPTVDFTLASKVRRVLNINKEERHIRGGLATKKKYQDKKLLT